MPLLKRVRNLKSGSVVSWVVRITYIEQGREKQKWRSLRTSKKPPAATVAKVETEFWEEVNARRFKSALPKGAVQDRGEVGSSIRKYMDWLGARKSESHAERTSGILHNVMAVLGTKQLVGWTSPLFD